MRSAFGLEVDRDINWRGLAACSPATADWFFTSDRHSGGGLSENNRRALRICRTCPVRWECLTDALADPEKQSRIAGGELVRKGQVVDRGKSIPRLQVPLDFRRCDECERPFQSTVAARRFCNDRCRKNHAMRGRR